MAKYRLNKTFVESLGPIFPKRHPKAGQTLRPPDPQAGFAGDRYTVMDDQLPGFGVRVTSSGARTYILRCRIKGQPDAIRRTVGEVGGIELADAREQAQDWLALVRKGLDPKAEQERQALEKARRRANSFAAVAEDFIKEKVLGPKCYDEWKAMSGKGRPATPPLERKGFEVARDIGRDLLPAWGKLPITEITEDSVLDVIEAKAETAPAQARNLLGTVKRFFAWAQNSKNRRRYGLTASPAAALKPKDVIGDKKNDDRTLTDDEIRALWRAAERMPHPHGPVYKMLLLTALRLNEAADAAEREFDFSNNVWTIPAERMKGLNAKPRPHEVPLTNDIKAILDTLPRIEKKHRKGDFLFSTTLGESPVWMSDKIKKKTDALMIDELRKMAEDRGDDPKKVKLVPWKNHHIRHTIRTALSALEVREEVCEAVVAHVQPGIKGVYNHHKYFKEKCTALELWADKLRAIIHPERALESANVTQLRATKA